jgi:hypothetical protein
VRNKVPQRIAERMAQIAPRTAAASQ